MRATDELFHNIPKPTGRIDDALDGDLLDLLDEGYHADLLDERYRAIINHDIGSVERLMAEGVNPNAVINNSFTSLTLAAYEGDVPVTGLLLRYGGNPFVKDGYGDTAFQSALDKEHLPLFNFLLEYSTPNERQRSIVVFDAVTSVLLENNVALTQALLEYVTDINRTGEDGFTLLGWAAYNGHSEVAEILLKHGADKNALDAVGKTASETARQQGHNELAAWLAPTAIKKKASRQPAPRRSHVKAASRGQSDAPVPEPKRDIDPNLLELESLIGLTGVKADVMEKINFLRVQQMRKSKGLSVPEQSLHMVFTGNPGTGKTTIARLIAKIYKSIGILNQGQFVETDRSGLVAGYLGHTAINVQAVVNSAVGGVLFIDEAYSLTQSGSGRDEFGYEAVNTLVKLMEDHRDDLIVIVAGYTEPMQRFIKSNPGLRSRFNKFLHFEDYSPAELTEIFARFARQSDYQLTSDAAEKLDHVFTSLHTMRDETFGNARLARNLFERAINNHANRLSMLASLDEVSLTTLLAEDIPTTA